MKWIRVEDQLPTEYLDFLVSCNNGVHSEKCIRVAMLADFRDAYNGERWLYHHHSCGCCSDWDGKSITHWMPLPEPPEEPK